MVLNTTAFLVSGKQNEIKNNDGSVTPWYQLAFIPQGDADSFTFTATPTAYDKAKLCGRSDVFLDIEISNEQKFDKSTNSWKPYLKHKIIDVNICESNSKK